MHPLAWWAWALGIAVAFTRTTNPAAIALMLAATVLVVVVRRDGSPWARAFGAYLVLGVAVVVVRVVFYVLFGLKTGGPVLLDLPSVPLPAWAAGVALLGPVHLTGLLDAAYGGLRLAALIICFGAANALANPKRALRCMPASLDRMGTAVVIAVTVSPQLVTSLARVRRAQRLRGQDIGGLRGALAGALPVLQDGLDGALALAASMDSRGYARSTPGRSDPRVTAALVAALLAATMGAYGLLDATSPEWLGAPMLVVGALVAIAGSVVAGRRSRRTRYRPDPWRLQESVVAGCGAATALVAFAVSRTGAATLGASFGGSGPSSTLVGAALCAVVVALPSALPTAGFSGWWR